MVNARERCRQSLHSSFSRTHTCFVQVRQVQHTQLGDNSSRRQSRGVALESSERVSDRNIEECDYISVTPLNGLHARQRVELAQS